MEALSHDYSTAGLATPDSVMLNYVTKLTRAPATISLRDAEAVRAAGFDERGLHDICVVAAYYAFVNRVADGLGVELEPRFGE